MDEKEGALRVDSRAPVISARALDRLPNVNFLMYRFDLFSPWSLDICWFSIVSVPFIVIADASDQIGMSLI